MIKQCKAEVLRLLAAFMLALFLVAVTGCCPGGPGCDWYSSDNEPKKETQSP